VIRYWLGAAGCFSFFSFSFSSTLWCCSIGDHLEECLAKFLNIQNMN